jgi:hypothetical protein
MQRCIFSSHRADRRIQPRHQHILDRDALLKRINSIQGGRGSTASALYPSCLASLTARHSVSSMAGVGRRTQMLLVCGFPWGSLDGCLNGPLKQGGVLATGRTAKTCANAGQKLGQHAPCIVIAISHSFQHQHALTLALIDWAPPIADSHGRRPMAMGLRK